MIGQSAANLKQGSSEAIRRNKQKLLSVHRPKPGFPTEKKIGYYLAGLIDSKSTITTEKIIISLNEKDRSLAYKIRTFFKYGKVLKYEKETIYQLTHPKGLVKMIKVIYGKLQNKSKENDLNVLIKHLEDKENLNFNLKKEKKFNLLNNFYFTGYFDSAGSFSSIIQPKSKLMLKDLIIDKFINSSESSYDLKIYLPIHENQKEFLNTLKKDFQDSKLTELEHEIIVFCLDSLKSVLKCLQYFDHFPLQSKKYIDYVQKRKDYLKIQENFYKKRNSN